MKLVSLIFLVASFASAQTFVFDQNAVAYRMDNSSGAFASAGTFWMVQARTATNSCKHEARVSGQSNQFEWGPCFLWIFSRDGFSVVLLTAERLGAFPAGTQLAHDSSTLGSAPTLPSRPWTGGGPFAFSGTWDGRDGYSTGDKIDGVELHKGDAYSGSFSFDIGPDGQPTNVSVDFELSEAP